MFEQEFRTISGKPNGFSNLSPQTILFAFVFILIIGSSFVMSIRSEINSYQSQQAIIQLNSSVETLEKWKNQQTEKQQFSTQELDDHAERLETLRNQVNGQTVLIQKQDVQIENLEKMQIVKGDSQILNLKEKLSGYSQLIIDFYVLKEKFESLSKQVDKLTPTSNGPTTTTPNLSLDLIDLKIASAISGLKLDILNGQMENTNQIKITQASLIGLPAQISEFQVQFALQKQIIQNLQTNNESALAQISQQAPLFVDIPIIKKNVLDLQTSLNDHIKQVNSVSSNTGSTSQSTQQSSSGSTTETSSEATQPSSGSNNSTTTQQSTVSTQTSTNVEYNQTQILEPFVTPSWHQILTVFSTEFVSVTTNVPCIITVKKKAIITLNATGVGRCLNCHGLITFKKNGIINLPLTNYKNFPFGVSSLYGIWHPINYTQEFIVEPGTYEFQIGVGVVIDVTNVSIELIGISFVAKISYYL